MCAFFLLQSECLVVDKCTASASCWGRRDAKGGFKVPGHFCWFHKLRVSVFKIKPFFQTQGVSAHASCSEVPEIPTELNMNLSETQLVVWRESWHTTVVCGRASACLKRKLLDLHVIGWVKVCSMANKSVFMNWHSRCSEILSSNSSAIKRKRRFFEQVPTDLRFLFCLSCSDSLS